MAAPPAAGVEMTSWQRAMRTIRHLLADQCMVARLIPPASIDAISRAIVASEKRHDGEIRFCIEAGLPWSYLKRNAPARERALMLFSKLRVWDTERNTGVLVYILLADKSIEIVADRGIARKLPQETWSAICELLGARFRAGEAGAGVLVAIERIGDALVAHFPPQSRNDNELPDAPAVL